MSHGTSAMLDRDFGSEEEDDDFNPVAGDVSDPEPEDETNDKGRSFENVEGEYEDKRKESNHSGAHEVGDENAKKLREDEEKNKERLNANMEQHRRDEQNGETEHTGDNDAGSEVDDEGEDEGEDDEEGDDDEDDDDEEEVRDRPRKRRRRGPLGFFEMEAVVDDEDEAEEDEDDIEPGFVHADDEPVLPAGEESDDRRHRELDRKRDLEATIDAEKQAQALKERYGRNRASGADLVVVPKRLLLPSVDDPSIWGVKCRPGKEREIVFSIMKRMEERPQTSRNPIRIISAFERGGTMSGYVYVEARKQADIIDALDGMSNIYVRTKMTLISVKEMPDLLRVKKSEELLPGGWVRIKRGKYQGDLAQIEEVETNGLNVTVRLVPRLEYGLNEDSNAPNGDIKRKRPGVAGNMVARPPQRLFSEAEAKKRHHKYLSSTSGLGGKSWSYLGDTYVDGFLVKDMKVQHLITKNVNPQLDEVTKFARGADDGTSNLDLAALAATIKNNSQEDSYVPGDTVEVYTGEQRGVVGQTVSSRGDIVTIKVSEGDLYGQTMDVPVKGLRKRFREGDHVKVIGGSKYRDELGMVVRIKDDRVTILTDMTMQEITVFSKDLREADDIGVDGKLGQYDVHDLVQLDQTTAGCIIKLDRESMRVIDQNGSVLDVLPSRVLGKIEQRRNAVTTDRNGAEIKIGDTVKEASGEQRSGVILHIHRAFLFCNSKVIGNNSGIIVTRAINVTTMATSGSRLGGRSAPDFSKMNPALQKNGMNGTGMPPPRTFGRDRLVGKTVTIRKGPYKGLLGIVKDTTDVIARVELHSVSKVVPVEKENLVAKDPVTGQAIDINRFGGGRGGPSRVPQSMATGNAGLRDSAWQGGRTPIAAGDSSRTPSWRASSSRTPAWNAGLGSRTPAWKAEGARTVYEGNRTSYAGIGGRTPAWTSGAKTPHDSSSGLGNASSGSGFEAFMAGSRTPGHPSAMSGSRTPAWGATAKSSSHLSASSSRAYDAPTPGGDYSAPSPAAFGSAPTPGASAATPGAWPDNAPTPGAFSGKAYDAPTPAGSRGYDAPTPAGMGFPATPGAIDDAPRYAEGTPSP
ncbi:transcription elongation factor spt5 [Myotisia sp. PD_48]|nr:transcription elongation factor spt5 [Myotisia sp. PD_48]